NDVVYDVKLNITIHLQNPTTKHRIEIDPPMKLVEPDETIIRKIETVLPFGSDVTLDYSWFGQPNIIIYLPQVDITCTFQILGQISGSSVIYRNVAQIYMPEINTTIIETPPIYRLQAHTSASTNLLKLFQHLNSGLSYVEEVDDDYKVITATNLNPPEGLDVPFPVIALYQPSYWELNAIIIMLVLIGIIIVIAYLSVSYRRPGQSQIPGIMFLLNFWQQLSNRLSKVNTLKMFQLFIICAILMVSLSLAAGPEPRLKLYVFTHIEEEAEGITQYIEEQGGVAITSLDEISDLEAMTNLGIFSGIIIGARGANVFFTSTNPDLVKYLSDYVYPALNAIPYILIIDHTIEPGFPEPVDPAAVTNLQQRYPGLKTSVINISRLGQEMNRLRRFKRPNAFGLNLPVDLFNVAAALVGLLSFILLFLGLASFSSKVVEAGKAPGLQGFTTVLFYAVSIFIFTQTVFSLCGLLLAYPLGLHATIPKVTAIGLLGFGGGNRPRLFAGIGGMLFGTIITAKQGSRISVTGIIAIITILLFLVIDPLTNGIFFYELAMVLLVAPIPLPAIETWSIVRYFLGTITRLFGAWASPVYGISLGITLYYTGAISFYAFSKVTKGSATLLLIFSAFATARGYIRIADMSTWKAIASMIPGVFAGLLFFGVFLFIDQVEISIRKLINRLR
ncbi:MAG: hypothetical protein JSV76_02770, partial [Candidatus Bathyarchaeota archaeon]